MQRQRVEPGVNSEPAAIIHRMRRPAQLIARRSDDVLLASCLSRADFDILALLTRIGEALSPPELAEDLITSGPGTTKRIRTLVGTGMVTREANPADGRGALIRLTKPRHDTIIPARRNISALGAELLSTPPATGREQLAGLLRELLLNVEPPAAPQNQATAARQPKECRPVIDAYFSYFLLCRPTGLATVVQWRRSGGWWECWFR